MTTLEGGSEAGMGYDGKLVEDCDLADGVFVVEGGRFPLHRNVQVRSE